MQKVKVGILGCGRISKCHFDAISANNHLFDFVAVCDVNKKALKLATDSVSVRGYDNLKSMLATENLDLVVICTPNGFHFENAKLILKYGINVMVEKPLALSFKHGQILMNLAKKNAAKVFLIHQNRFNPTVQCVKSAINDGAFGKIYMMTSNIFWHRDDDYYKNPSWHGSKLIDGGAFITQGSHYTDIMNWFSGGDLKSIYAVGKTLERNIETEDCGSAVIEWKNGIIGNVNISVLAYGDNYEGSITILGQKGLVKIGGVALNEIIDWKFDIERKVFCDVSYGVSSVYGFGHTPYYKSVAETLLNGREFLISDNDAMGSLKLITGIAKSIDKKKIIKF